MKASLKERFGFWLERLIVLRHWLYIYDGETPDGGIRAINRVNGHVVRLDTNWRKY